MFIGLSWPLKLSPLWLCKLWWGRGCGCRTSGEMAVYVGSCYIPWGCLFTRAAATNWKTVANEPSDSLQPSLVRRHSSHSSLVWLVSPRLSSCLHTCSSGGSCKSLVGVKVCAEVCLSTLRQTGNPVDNNITKSPNATMTGHMLRINQSIINTLSTVDPSDRFIWRSCFCPQLLFQYPVSQSQPAPFYMGGIDSMAVTEPAQPQAPPPAPMTPVPPPSTTSCSTGPSPSSQGSETSFDCTHCGKSLRSRKNYSKHMFIHSGETRSRFLRFQILHHLQDDRSLFVRTKFVLHHSSPVFKKHTYIILNTHEIQTWINAQYKMSRRKRRVQFQDWPVCQLYYLLPDRTSLYSVFRTGFTSGATFLFVLCI